MTDFAILWASATWDMMVQAAPWLLGGFLIAGFVHILVPVASITRHLGQPGLSGVLKASLLGIPLPLCSCSVIPVAVSIRKQGASRGAFASFLISAPETGADSIALTYALLGPVLAVVRPLAAFVTAVVVGVLVGNDPPSPSTLPTTEESGCCCGSKESSAPDKKKGLVEAIRYGLIEMMSDLAPWLLAGFILAGLVTAALPADFLERHVGSSIGSMLLMLVIGLPLYVCATSSTPFAAALIAKGLSPGAALVFLLAGPATNLATMLVVSRDLGRRGLFVYVSGIAVVAVGFGLLLDRLIAVFPSALSSTPVIAHEHSSVVAPFFAIALCVLILNGLRIRMVKSKPEG